MESHVKLREEQLEYLRSTLYECVDGMPSLLCSSKALVVSKLLDDLVIEVQKAKQKIVVQ